MTFCLNPVCQKPENPELSEFCRSCGTKLLLQQRYRAVKPIGQGGFGRTFLAIDENKPSKPHCVIKQFLPQVQGTQAFRKASELFEREAVQLDELGKHPQIPELLAYFTQDQRQYLIQEFVNGCNLYEKLEVDGVFSEANIRQILNDLLLVLDFVHSHNVIHRDIKPENIICKHESGQFVLVDFGASKPIIESFIAQPGTVIGSAEYAAPEQMRGEAVFASDLYSLGVTCIYLLTSIHPFDLFSFHNGNQVWRHYLIDNPVSEELNLILHKLLEPDVSARYQSTANVFKDLNPSVVPPSVLAQIQWQEERQQQNSIDWKNL